MELGFQSIRSSSRPYIFLLYHMVYALQKERMQGIRLWGKSLDNFSWEDPRAELRSLWEMIGPMLYEYEIQE